METKCRVGQRRVDNAKKLSYTEARLNFKGGKVMNSINTWRQGYFVDQRRYDQMPQSWKDECNKEEHLLVRPGPVGNAICKCATPEDAKWIASRLNLASNLEQLTYDAEGPASATKREAIAASTIERR